MLQIQEKWQVSRHEEMVYDSQASEECTNALNGPRLMEVAGYLGMCVHTACHWRPRGMPAYEL